MTAHFHGTIRGSNKSVTVRGSTQVGLLAILQTRSGGLRVECYRRDGQDRYRVELFHFEENDMLRREVDPLLEGVFPMKKEAN